MEKTVWLLLGPPGQAMPDLARELKDSLPLLRHRGARRIQMNAADPGLGHPFGVEPAADSTTIAAAISCWVDSAEGSRIGSALPPVSGVGTWHGWLVCESEPLPLREVASEEDGRLPGFAQIVALTRPESVSWGEWRRRWQAEHTPIAVNTQSVFRYVQNVVFRPLTVGAPAYAAISEECFPPEAASDLNAFFDSVGDDARLARHMAAMSESCDRFMGPLAPVAWTSEWIFPDH
jgi:hypothetical protein